MNMKDAKNVWSRRTFLSAAALSGAAAATSRLMPSKSEQGRISSGDSIAFVGYSNSVKPDAQRIESYRIQNGTWARSANAFFADKPHALAMHPTLPVLYVAHSTDLYGNLPRGSVSALRVDGAAGVLKQISREGLALSATKPGHLAVSPDGSKLLVSATGGGAYNLFSLASDGSILPTAYPIKETGSGPHPLQTASQPHTVRFNRDGSAAYGSDFGTDHVAQIRLSSAAPAVVNRIALMSGSGPADMVIHPSGKFLIVSSKLKPRLSVVRTEADQQQAIADQVGLDTVYGGQVALNRSGSRVYAASMDSAGNAVVATFALSSTSGKLVLLRKQKTGLVGRAMQLVQHDDHLILTGSSGVVSMAVYEKNGQLDEAKLVVNQPGAVSIAIHKI